MRSAAPGSRAARWSRIAERSSSASGDHMTFTRAGPGKVAERFRTIAARREAGAHGYGDHNSDRRATPEALRKAVDAYNGANQHTKDLYFERIQREPQMARAVEQLINDRELVLQRDRGLSR